MGRVFVNGEEWNKVDRKNFQIQLDPTIPVSLISVEFIPNPDYVPQAVM